jgi:hypothetical protein
VAEDLGLAGFAGVLGLAAGYAEGYGWRAPSLMGDAAVDEVAYDTEESFFGVITIFGVVFRSQEGCELSGLEQGEVGLLAGIAGDQGVRNAVGAEEYGGAQGEAEE